MRIPINLASQPFRRDRAMLVASAAVSAVLVFTLGGLVYLAGIDRAQSAQLRGDLVRLNNQIQKATAEQSQLDLVMHKPENAIAVETSVFINSLILHKSMSWTRLFEDLEKTVPYNVKLMSLVPSLNAQNKVVLDIYAAAEKQEDLVELARALEHSTVFHNVYGHQTQQPTQAEPFWKGRVTVNYAQKL